MKGEVVRGESVTLTSVTITFRVPLVGSSR